MILDGDSELYELPILIAYVQRSGTSPPNLESNLAANNAALDVEVIVAIKQF
jgi:hypothetical protein